MVRHGLVFAGPIVAPMGLPLDLDQPLSLLSEGEKIWGRSIYAKDDPFKLSHLGTMKCINCRVSVTRNSSFVTLANPSIDLSSNTVEFRYVKLENCQVVTKITFLVTAFLRFLLLRG